MKAPPFLADVMESVERAFNCLLNYINASPEQRQQWNSMNIDMQAYLLKKVQDNLKQFRKFNNVNTALEFLASHPMYRMKKIGDEFHIILSDNELCYKSVSAYGNNPIDTL